MMPSPSILNESFTLPLSLRNKISALLPDIQLQEHQQRIADRISGEDPRLLVYHGLGSGKSLSSIAAAEEAKEEDGEDYGVVVPASLRGNFEKEIKKFTTGSNPEIMSYTGLALGKKFQNPPDTLIMDEAHRLRNPGSASAAGAAEAAAKAKRLLLLTGSPITNSPTDLANLLAMLNNKQITPEEFEKRYIGYQKVRPGLFGWLRGAKPGMRPVVKNEKELRSLLAGKVDYQPSKTPDGVNVNEEVVRVPLSSAQQKIQQAIRTKIPPGFLWKLDQEFPLSREELAKLNSFLSGLRQVSLSTQPFRADKDPAKAFTQSAKLQTAFQNLKKTLAEDKRKKAIIYSNFIDSGLAPYAAGLEQAKIPHAFFHGGVSPKARQAAVDAYNSGKLRALLIGPAGAEGLSTRGTSLIQLLDPHWHESRSQQARGRGLRFDSHVGLPEELKNVQVQRYLSTSQDPSWLGKLMGYQRERTGDEILEHLTADKERLNEVFRKILKEEGDKYRKQKEQEKQAVSPRYIAKALAKIYENVPAARGWRAFQSGGNKTITPTRLAKLLKRVNSWADAKIDRQPAGDWLNIAKKLQTAPPVIRGGNDVFDEPGSLTRPLQRSLRKLWQEVAPNAEPLPKIRVRFGFGPAEEKARGSLQGMYRHSDHAVVLPARTLFDTKTPSSKRKLFTLFHELGHSIDVPATRGPMKKIPIPHTDVDTRAAYRRPFGFRDTGGYYRTESAPHDRTDWMYLDHSWERPGEWRDEVMAGRRGLQLYRDWHRRLMPELQQQYPTPSDFYKYTKNHNNYVGLSLLRGWADDVVKHWERNPAQSHRLHNMFHDADFYSTKSSAELPNFQPDFTPGQLHRMGVYKSLYEKEGPQLASLGEWKPEWVTEHDPKGWLEWYQNYNAGRRIPDEDARQIKRWASFKARHGGPFMTNPTPRRGWALRHWAIDPTKLVSRVKADEVKTMLQAYQEKELQKYLKRRQREADAENELIEKESGHAGLLSRRQARLLKYSTVSVCSSSILESNHAADFRQQNDRAVADSAQAV